MGSGRGLTLRNPAEDPPLKAETLLLWLTYAAAAWLVLFLSKRYVAPVSRGAGLVLALLPLVFAGKAFLTGGVYGPADLYYGHDPWKRTAEAQAIGPHVAISRRASDERSSSRYSAKASGRNAARM